MTKVFKVVVRRQDGRLTSVKVGGQAEVEYFAGKWVSAPGWLKDKGYHPTCFPFTLEGLKAALDLVRHTEAELWLAEGKGLSGPDKYRGKQALSPQTILAEEIRLLRRVGKGKVDGFAVVQRGEDGHPRNVFSPEDRYIAKTAHYLEAQSPHLQVMFPHQHDAERQMRGAGTYVTRAMGFGVVLTPFSVWAPEKKEFRVLVKAWPPGAVQAGWMLLPECWR